MNKINSTLSNFKNLSKRAKRPLWRSWLFLSTLFCALLFLAGIGWLVANEVRASKQFEVQRQQRLDRGLPVDNASIEKWFKINTHSEGTMAWREILQLSDGVNSLGFYESNVPFLGDVELRDSIDPDQPWTGEPQVAEFLEAIRPLLDRIEDATQYPTPVWQPILFDGFQTFLGEIQLVRGVSRVLCAEIEHALYHRDADRALRGFQSLRYVIDAFNWDINLVSQLVNSAIQGMYQSMILRSLSCEVWQEAHAEQLLEQIGAGRDLGSHWRNMFDGEMATGLATLSDPEQWVVLTGSPNLRFALRMLAMPTSKLRLLEDYQEIASMGQGGHAELQRETEALRERLEQAPFSNILSSMLLPATQAVAATMERTEDGRRFCRTAVAVKLFQLRNGRWPQNLNELEQVGIEPSDRMTIRSGPFGYSVENEVAFVWSRDITSYRDIDPDKGTVEARRVPTARPSAMDEAFELSVGHGAQRNHLETLIR